VPAPATARLLAGVPIYSKGSTEMVTPTGALLLTGYAREWGEMPLMAIDQIGYGAGDRDPKGTPNVLRVLKGNRRSASPDETIVKLECEIDDMNPQLFGPLMNALLAAGAHDVFYTPVQMKKNRPGTLITVIAAPELRAALTDLLFRESTSIGIRYEEMARTCLERAVETVATPYGPIRVKVARRDGRVLNAAPEFDDCVAAATKHGASVKDVQAAAIAARR
jgi:pyridinium-3,5-bisthiocarboxylic acid mononucleotide nickel chelatase